jgi:putative transposase
MNGLGEAMVPPGSNADLTMERRVRCGKKRVARIMRNAGIRGVCHQRKRRGWKPLPPPHDDLVKRQFTAHATDRVWF